MVEEKIVQAENQSKKRYRFWIFIFVGIIIFFGAVYGIWLFLQSPAIGEVHVKTVVSQVNTDQIKKKKEYAGKYVAFSYSDVYTEKAHTIPVKGPTKESIFLTESGLEGRKIAIVVEERIGGDFEASPGYLMRVNKPKEYEKEVISIGGYKGVIFRKNTVVFERTFFLHDGDFVITVSTTSPMNAEGLEEELSTTLDSLRFLE